MIGDCILVRDNDRSEMIFVTLIGKVVDTSVRNFSYFVSEWIFSFLFNTIYWKFIRKYLKKNVKTRVNELICIKMLFQSTLSKKIINRKKNIELEISCASAAHLIKLNEITVKMIEHTLQIQIKQKRFDRLWEKNVRRNAPLWKVSIWEGQIKLAMRGDVKSLA